MTILMGKCYAQKFKTISSAIEPCWQAVKLSDSLNGTIISYFNNPFLCGKVPTASIAIVKLYNGDTLRILELCSGTKIFKPGDTIMIYPHRVPEVKNVLLPSDKDAIDCKISKTTYGRMRINSIRI